MSRRGGTEKGQPDELAFLFITPTASEQKVYRRHRFTTSDIFPPLSFVDVAARLMEMGGGGGPLAEGPVGGRRVEGVTLSIRIGEM